MFIHITIFFLTHVKHTNIQTNNCLEKLCAENNTDNFNGRKKDSTFVENTNQNIVLLKFMSQYCLQLNRIWFLWLFERSFCFWICQTRTQKKIVRPKVVRQESIGRESNDTNSERHFKTQKATFFFKKRTHKKTKPTH